MVIISLSYQLLSPTSLISIKSQKNLVELKQPTSTERFQIPDLPLDFTRLLNADLSSIDSVKGWISIGIDNDRPHIIDKQFYTNFIESSMVTDPFTGHSFAFQFQDKTSKLGLAWLPNPVFRVLPWVRLICTEWGKLDRERFPNFGNWAKSPEWMTKNEERLANQLDTLELEKQNLDF